jgi:Kef-type K+ transport system membrane component KefB
MVSAAMTLRSVLHVGFGTSAIVLAAGNAWAQPQAGHGDPVAPVVLSLAVLLITGKIGGEIATRVGQPAVLGELVGGILLGGAGALGLGVLEPLKTDPTVAVFASLGVLLLLFAVGLESTVPHMLRLAKPALLVAALGVLSPFALVSSSVLSRSGRRRASTAWRSESG